MSQNGSFLLLFCVFLWSSILQSISAAPGQLIATCIILYDPTPAHSYDFTSVSCSLTDFVKYISLNFSVYPEFFVNVAHSNSEAHCGLETMRLIFPCWKAADKCVTSLETNIASTQTSSCDEWNQPFWCFIFFPRWLGAHCEANCDGVGRIGNRRNALKSERPVRSAGATTV